MELDFWTRLLHDFGYPALFVLGTAVAWIAMIRWAKPHAEGMIADHRALVQATTRSVGESAIVQQKTSSEVEKIAVAIRQLVDSQNQAIREIAASQAQTFRSLESHHDWSRGKVLELELALRELAKSTERAG